MFTGHNDDSPTQESQGFYAEHFPLCKIFPPNLEYNTLCLLYFKLREVLWNEIDNNYNLQLFDKIILQ